MKKIFPLFIFIIMFAGGFIVYRFIPFYTRPTVSVVLPTYNRHDLLRLSIESILNQTYTDFELIVIDNGSTDGTMEMLNSYAKKDKRVKIIFNETNRGISYARNLGNQAARGTYIVIMDSDDISTHDRLEKQVKFMQENPDVTVASSWKKELDSGIVWRRSTDEQELLFAMHFNNILGHPETIMRRDFLVKYNIQYDESLVSSVDYDLFKQIIFAGGKIARQPVTILLYRMHMENGAAYYRAQSQTRRRISRAFLNKYGIDWNGDPNPTCELVRQMMDNTDKVGLLKKGFLRKKEYEICHLAVKKGVQK